MHIFKFLVLPAGCGNVRGPFSPQCLNSMWLESNCLKEGSGFPENLDFSALIELNDLTIM